MMFEKASAATCLLVLTSTAWSQQYSVTPIDLHTSQVSANRINNAGQVVGSVTLSGASHGFLWSNGAATLLDAYPGSAHAFGIDDSDTCVGTSISSGGAIVWSNGQFRDIGSLIPGGHATGYALNDQGWIVGGSEYIYHGQLVGRPFFYRDGQMVSMGDTGNPSLDEQGGAALAINSSGMATGIFINREATLHASFWWTESAGLNLFLLGSDANDINDEGQIVGRARNGGEIEAFVWQNGNITYLGGSAASGINNRGEIVGYGAQGGILWRNNVATPLDSLIPAGWLTSGGIDINDHGQILADAFNTQTNYAGPVLLAPVPEPISLLTCGLLLLGFRRRKALKVDQC